jgi:hypothetical protein
VSAPGAASGNNRPKKRGWFITLGGGSLSLSILLHVLFAAGATLLVVEHFQKKHINFHATEPPSQHTEVEHKVELAKRNNEESAPPDLKRIVTTDVSSITLPEPPELPNDEATPTAMAGVEGVMGMGIGSGVGKGGNGAGGGIPLFGAPDGTGLEGYFYDLKQTADGKPTGMTQEQWCLIMAKFIAQGWDDSLLAPYYKGQKPLYADMLAISTRLSEEGPKAFALENEVQPALWCAHYHGKAMAPKEGDYRFMGFGDDLIVVRINGVLVLDAGTVSVSPKADVHQLLPNVWSRLYGGGEVAAYVPGMGPGSGLLKIGPAFHMDKAKPVDMDVLIGDQGGSIAFFLLIEKVGNTYETLPDDTPVIPFFQLNNGVAPTFSSNEEHPPYNMIPEPWTVAAQ